MEKSKDREIDFHGGLELLPHPVLALRGGYNAGNPAYGAGIRWRGFAIDYVLEDNEIESVHRFGIGIGFGSTVEEKRLAAEAKEEERFRQRLADTFQRRQDERILELVQQGEALLSAGEHEAVLDVVATVRVLEPGHEGARRLEARNLMAMAALEEAGGDLGEAAFLYGSVLAITPDDVDAAEGMRRCRAESDRRAARTARIREQFDTAMDAFTSGELRDAHDQFAAILEIEPDDREAHAMLTRTVNAIETRTAELLGRAEQYVGRGLLTEADELLLEVAELDPRADGLAALTERVREAERELQAAARRQREAVEVARASPPVAKAPALSRKRREEIADLYRRGMGAMEAGEADDALRYWELVWSADPEYQNVAEYLKEEYLLRGLDSFSNGGLDEAVRLWEKALEVDPDDEKALGYLARAREQLARTHEILGTKP